MTHEDDSYEFDSLPPGDYTLVADGVPVGRTDGAGDLVLDLPSAPARLGFDPREQAIHSDGGFRSRIDAKRGRYDARNGVMLGVYLRRVAPTTLLELRVPRLCELQIEGADGFDALRVLSDADEMLPIRESFGAFLSMRETAGLVEGRSSVVQVDERAAFLVPVAEGEERARMALELDPLELTVVRPRIRASTSGRGGTSTSSRGSGRRRSPRPASGRGCHRS